MNTVKKLLDKLRDGDFMHLLRCTAECIAVFGFYFIALLPVLFIILNAHRLGRLWLPIVIAYMLLFIIATGYRIRRKMLREEHLVVGDELFYELHPRELHRKERRAKRQRAAEERRAEKREY